MTKLQGLAKIEQIEKDIDMPITKNQRTRELRITIEQMSDEIGECQDRLHKLYDGHREAINEFNELTDKIVN